MERGNLDYTRVYDNTVDRLFFQEGIEIVHDEEF